MKSVKPLGNRVLVERSKAKTTARGILLPDSAQEKPKEGTIIAVGPGKLDENGKTIPLNVKVGDRVLFTSYAGTEVKSTCENSSGCEGEYLILSEDEILGILVSA